MLRKVDYTNEDKDEVLNNVKDLVSKGFPINSHSSFALKKASKHGHYELVKYAIEKATEKELTSAFAIACESDCEKIVGLFLEKGVDVKINNSKALISAVKKDNHKIVSALISHGADVKAADNISLHYATLNGNLDTVKLLINKGSCISTLSCDIVCEADKKGHTSVVNYLIDQGVKTKLSKREVKVAPVKKSWIKNIFNRV